MATGISGGQTQHGRICRISQRRRQAGRLTRRQTRRQAGRLTRGQTGRQTGRRTNLVLERQLQRRFGVLTPEITEKLSEASSVDLENWAENVLDAETLDDVFDSSH